RPDPRSRPGRGSHRTVAAAQASPGHDGSPVTGADHVGLVAPPGWRVTELSDLRLRDQLDRAPAGVVGVVALGGALPMGATYRTHAEHLALTPAGELSELARRIVAGAIVVRPGVDVEVASHG